MKQEGPVGFEVRVNRRKAVRAVLPGEGVLVFHVALERAIGTESSEKRVTIYGVDLYGTDTTGSRFMRWANLKVAVGDKIAVRFVIGGRSSPRPRVLIIDNVETRLGLTERLRGLKKEIGEVRRKLALSEPERRRQGLREWKRTLASQRRKLAAVKRAPRIRRPLRRSRRV
jgi:hypothetical protein